MALTLSRFLMFLGGLAFVIAAILILVKSSFSYLFFVLLGVACWYFAKAFQDVVFGSRATAV